LVCSLHLPQIFFIPVNKLFGTLILAIACLTSNAQVHYNSIPVGVSNTKSSAHVNVKDTRVFLNIGTNYTPLADEKGIALNDSTVLQVLDLPDTNFITARDVLRPTTMDQFKDRKMVNNQRIRINSFSGYFIEMTGNNGKLNYLYIGVGNATNTVILFGMYKPNDLAGRSKLIDIMLSMVVVENYVPTFLEKYGFIIDSKVAQYDLAKAESNLFVFIPHADSAQFARSSAPSADYFTLAKNANVSTAKLTDSSILKTLIADNKNIGYTIKNKPKFTPITIFNKKGYQTTVQATFNKKPRQIFAAAVLLGADWYVFSGYTAAKGKAAIEPFKKIISSFKLY
jgi:hypothetical protein